MADVTISVLRSSGEEVDLLIQGEAVGSSQQVIYDPSGFGGDHPTARLMSMVFAVESGLRLFLEWEGTKQENILPLEGRGTLDFSKYGGLTNPRAEGWTGRIVLRMEADQTPRFFTLAVELSKQRR